MKYKVGDVVKAAETCPMETLAGQMVTIYFAGATFYEIEEDGGMYAWKDEDFVGGCETAISSEIGYNDHIEMLVDHCKKVLTSKHIEYATDDHFHNFNSAAVLQGVTPQQALIGMMDKHVISVHDLVNEHAEGREISLDMWKEKIGDNINYLLILWAMVNMQG